MSELPIFQESRNTQIWFKATKKPITVEVTAVTETCLIKTLEGNMIATEGKDCIIKGVNGELYPIKLDIFRKTYDIEMLTPREDCLNED